jgi:hypothetical protein
VADDLGTAQALLREIDHHRRILGSTLQIFDETVPTGKLWLRVGR